MKIAQIAPLYESVPPKLYGGTERVVSWLTEELVKQGHDVTLFASGDSQTSAQLVAGWPRALWPSNDKADPNAAHMVMLEQVARMANEFDVLHFHVDYLHFPLSRRARLPQVSTLHGRLDLPELPAVYREFSEMPVVSISNSHRAPLPFANWQGTVYHGLPIDLHPFGEKRGDYLAFLGRVSPEKGLDRAIEIAKRACMPLKIAAKVPKADREYFEGHIKPLLDHPLIEFIGEVGGKDKDEFLKNAYALLFPIDWPEPFGLVMIESMACGTPVIGWRCGSVPEIVDDGKTGFVVECLDEAVEAVGRVESLSRRVCRQTFEERFSAARMAKDYLKVYRRVLEAAPRRSSLVAGATPSAPRRRLDETIVDDVRARETVVDGAVADSLDGDATLTGDAAAT